MDSFKGILISKKEAEDILLQTIQSMDSSATMIKSVNSDKRASNFECILSESTAMVRMIYKEDDTITLVDKVGKNQELSREICNKFLGIYSGTERVRIEEVEELQDLFNSLEFDDIKSGKELIAKTLTVVGTRLTVLLDVLLQLDRSVKDRVYDPELINVCCINILNCFRDKMFIDMKNGFAENTDHENIFSSIKFKSMTDAIKEAMIDLGCSFKQCLEFMKDRFNCVDDHVIEKQNEAFKEYIVKCLYYIGLVGVCYTYIKEKKTTSTEEYGGALDYLNRILEFKVTVF